MSVQSFKSVFMVASCAGAALGCYLVSLRVATERAALEDVESSIVMTQRDLRLLQTEIGTRGRLAQLERWNAKVIALSAPSADQFLNGSFELAKMTAPRHRPTLEAPVVLASAPSTVERPAPLIRRNPDADNASDTIRPKASSSGPEALMHQASLERTTEVSAKAAVARSAKPKTEDVRSEPRLSASVPMKRRTPAAAKSGLVDPLAPIPVKPAARKPSSLASASTPVRSREPAGKQ